MQDRRLVCASSVWAGWSHQIHAMRNVYVRLVHDARLRAQHAFVGRRLQTWNVNDLGVLYRVEYPGQAKSWSIRKSVVQTDTQMPVWMHK